MRRQENQNSNAKKCDISKGARYKNNPKREHTPLPKREKKC